MQRPEEPPEGGPSAPGRLAAVGRYSGYGLTIGAATALFAWIGSVLDERLHTRPLFVVLGTFIGFGAAFYRMYRQLVLDRRRDGDSQRAGDAG